MPPYPAGESEPETEIEYESVTSTGIVGPFEHTAKVTASYPLPSQREAIAETSLGWKPNLKLLFLGTTLHFSLLLNRLRNDLYCVELDVKL